MLSAAALLAGVIGVLWVIIWEIRNDKAGHINRQTGLFSMPKVEEADADEGGDELPRASRPTGRRRGSQPRGPRRRA